MVNATQIRYADKLKRAMDSAKPPVQIRTLAKDLRPDGVESMRRLIRRFLKGERLPGPQVAGEIVVALQARGADTTELEQDEEEDLDAIWRDLHDLASQLDEITSRLRRRMRGAA